MNELRDMLADTAYVLEYLDVCPKRDKRFPEDLININGFSITIEMNLAFSVYNDPKFMFNVLKQNNRYTLIDRLFFALNKKKA